MASSLFFFAKATALSDFLTAEFNSELKRLATQFSIARDLRGAHFTLALNARGFSALFGSCLFFSDFPLQSGIERSLSRVAA